MTKPVNGQTTFGASTTGTTTQLDNNFLLAYNALNDFNTYPNFLTDTGSANAIVVTLGANLTGVLTDGLIIQVKVSATSTGASTINYNSGGMKNIVLVTGEATPPGAMVGGTIAQFQYRASDTVWVLQTAAQPNIGMQPRNLVINPNWQIDQINEGALYTYSAATAVGPDGWSGSATGAGVFKLRTLIDPDNASLKCLEVTCTTADAAIGAADDYFIFTAVEGYDAAALGAGTAFSQSITIQFKFKSNVTGVYGLSIANSALNRRYIGIITVADANEHEYVTTLVMDTSGTWLYTNGVGLYFRICLAAGSNFQATAGAWAAGAEQTTSAQANFMSVNTNIAYLKRIQIVQGSAAMPYAPADLQKELAKAQRYYSKSYAQGTAAATQGGNLGAITYLVTTAGSATGGTDVHFPVTMRATPSITFFNTVSANANWRNESAAADSGAASAQASGATGFFAQNSQGAGDSDTQRLDIQYSASARLS